MLQYGSRWIIEEYHKAIKTGLGAERLQMEKAEHLFAAIAMMAVVALRLLDLREALRFHAHEPAEKSGLSDVEIKILQQKTKLKCITVRDIILAIGRMGGHLGRKGDGMPGWISLYNGMKEIKLMAEGVEMFLNGQLTGSD